MTKKPKKRKLVMIEWVDSVSTGGTVWNDLEDVEAAVVASVQSVGWVLSETKEQITLSPHISESAEQCSGDLTIPKCAIKRVRKLSHK